MLTGSLLRVGHEDQGAPLAIREFSVGPLRGLARAEAAGLDNLVVIAGPNGAGKSTLLELLRTGRQDFAEPGTEVLSASAYRTWRSEPLSKADVYSLPLPSFTAAMALDTWPNWNFGMPRAMQQLGGTPRSIAGSDEAQSFVKAGLVKLQDRQEALLTKTWRAQGGSGSLDDVPDLFAPFVRLVGSLLPHLTWVGIDESDLTNIGCLFRAAGSPTGPTFDIDDLSAGEKAAIGLLLPFVEQQAERLAQPVASPAGTVPITFLLDEPEIHLHPLLQLQVLQYLRDLAKEGSAQFILTTHSTTLLDALSDDELWLLSPAALRPDNQLSRLTTSQERLEAARTITRSTHLLTRAKPIVFVEGEGEGARVAGDAQLITALLPDTSSWALVPGRSKRDVVVAVQGLREGGVDLPGTPVFGLVDADRDEGSADEHVITWPVAMIENLLLDPDAIYQVLAPLKKRSSASSREVVARALEHAVEARVENEVQLRIKRRLHGVVGRLVLPPERVADPEKYAEEQVAVWLAKVKALDPVGIAATARQEVRAIVVADTALERFHGKDLLSAVHEALRVSGAGLSLPAFQLLVADRAAGTERIDRLARPAVQQVRLYFPAGLAECLRSGGGPDHEVLARECEEHRTAWEAKAPKEEGREDLRGRIFAHARSLPEQQRQQLVSLASEIGTP